MNNAETENLSLQNHVDWLLRSFLEQLDAMYGNELWSYGGYYDRDELAKRIRMQDLFQEKLYGFLEFQLMSQEICNCANLFLFGYNQYYYE